MLAHCSVGGSDSKPESYYRYTTVTAVQPELKSWAFQVKTSGFLAMALQQRCVLTAAKAKSLLLSQWEKVNGETLTGPTRKDAESMISDSLPCLAMNVFAELIGGVYDTQSAVADSPVK